MSNTNVPKFDKENVQGDIWYGYRNLHYHDLLDTNVREGLVC